MIAQGRVNEARLMHTRKFHWQMLSLAWVALMQNVAVCTSLRHSQSDKIVAQSIALKLAWLAPLLLRIIFQYFPMEIPRARDLSANHISSGLDFFLVSCWRSPFFLVQHSLIRLWFISMVSSNKLPIIIRHSSFDFSHPLEIFTSVFIPRKEFAATHKLL